MFNFFSTTTGMKERVEGGESEEESEGSVCDDDDDDDDDDDEGGGGGGVGTEKVEWNAGDAYHEETETMNESTSARVAPVNGCSVCSMGTISRCPSNANPFGSAMYVSFPIHTTRSTSAPAVPKQNQHSVLSPLLPPPPPLPLALPFR